MKGVKCNQHVSDRLENLSLHSVVNMETSLMFCFVILIYLTGTTAAGKTDQGNFYYRLFKIICSTLWYK